MSTKSKALARSQSALGSISGPIDPALLEALESICEKLETPIGIESSLAQIGCIKNEDGTLSASVMACKTVDEATGVEDIVIKAFYTTGEIVSPYTGEWSECSAPAPLINLGNCCY